MLDLARQEYIESITQDKKLILQFFPYGLIRSPSLSKKESIEFFVYLDFQRYYIFNF